MKYNIDFGKLTNWLTPFKLRKPKFLALLNVLVSQIKELHAMFVEFRDESQKQVGVLNQTLVLEDGLREMLGINNVRIVNQTYARRRNYSYFLAENSNDKIYTYNLNEEQPPEKIHLYYLNEQTQVDFVIYILKSFAASDEVKQKITAFIERYKLPDKIFKIEEVDVFLR